MRPLRPAWWVALWLIAALMPPCCASPGDEGHESNFLTCTRHGECDVMGSEYACIGGQCVIGPRSETNGGEDAGTDGTGSSCQPADCPAAPFGSPCCVGPEGPCGVESGFGCEPWAESPDAAL